MHFDSNLPKAAILQEVQAYIEKAGFHIIDQDFTRPWGGFFVLDESQVAKFVSQYFPQLSLDDIQITQKLSPKFLVVAPHQRLSWQYHFRRAEIWTVVRGPIGVAISSTDVQGDYGIYQEQDVIELPKGQRHRLIGLDHWGLVAEIWQHTDLENPSDESDIVRLQDDFGR